VANKIIGPAAASVKRLTELIHDLDRTREESAALRRKASDHIASLQVDKSHQPARRSRRSKQR
jgi:hypothetical protein